MAASKVFRLIPTRDGFWYVSRQDETMRMFPTKQMAWHYAYTIAFKSKPSTLVELTKDGQEITREEFL